MKNSIRVYFLGFFALFVASSVPTSLAAGLAPCDFQQLTEQVYVIVGSDHQTCPEKHLEYPPTNPAAIIGQNGVVLIDPGSSVQVGRLVLKRLASITDKPVVAVFNTHIHGLYWLGNQAVREQYPDARIYAHRRMIERIDKGEGDFWVKTIIGFSPVEKTEYVSPDVALNGGEIEVIEGITFRIHHTGHAHTDHDIIVELPEQKVVFVGGIVVEPEVPSQGVPQDADFKGQMDATRLVIALGADQYVPGQGRPEGVELPKRALRFLDALYKGVETYYEEGLADFEIAERLRTDLSSFEQWYDFSHLGGVVSQMYLQIEEKAF